MKKYYVLIIAIFIFNSVIAQSPTITFFSPVSGSAGTLLTVAGTNLSDAVSCTVGGNLAIIVSTQDTLLVSLIMPGTPPGKVSVTTANGTATSDGDFTVSATSFPSVQQGGKLVGAGAIGISQQGFSVAVSADGNTAIVGGISDNDIGAAWVFSRSADSWSQQGEKLVGTDSTIYATQGYSVALSADGNTAIVGGMQNNNNEGGAWVFIRSANEWSQQGEKLIGTGAVGAARFGSSVSLSADGNTAIIGGHGDSVRRGATWVFTRYNGIWSQQGDKLVGSGAVSMFSDQGLSVDVSADGNTAIIGGYSDNDTGAVWIFTRSGGIWSQQGEKLVGTNTSFSTSFGYSVSISADGNTAIVGGPYDNNQLGAVWIFTRSGDVWNQQGDKMVGTGVSGSYVHQGYSVSLSADGNLAAFGGPDAIGVGATWIFTRSDNTWSQQGDILCGTGGEGPYSNQGQSVALSSDGNTLLVGGDGDNFLVGAAWVFTSETNTIIQRHIKNTDVVIYPNPTNDKIFLECEPVLQNGEISIYNLLGQLILKQQLQKTEAIIDLANFTKGVYVIKVSNPERSIVKHLVKQ